MNWRSYARSLGPGVLYAASAVGTSHLVQSTRAGAEYGFGIAVVIVLVAFIKYPAIRFGNDYALATGRTLIHSYATLGRWAQAVYAVVLLVTMTFVVAALTLVTSSLLQTMIQPVSDFLIAVIVLGVSASLMIAGKYRLLENINRVMVPLFSVLIIIATVLVVSQIDWSNIEVKFPSVNKKLVSDVVQLGGWLLTPMDASVFLSLWVVARSQATGKSTSLAASHVDFNIGYWVSLLLALCFLLLGAALLYGNSTPLPVDGRGFSTQLIGLFTAAIGPWSRALITGTIILVMYSTLLTVLDGYARSAGTLAEIATELRLPNVYEGSVVVITIGAVVVIGAFMTSFTAFIDLVGTLTFLLGPIFAMLNHRAMFGAESEARFRPSRFMWCWSVFGIVSLIVIAVAYGYFRWIA